MTQIKRHYYKLVDGSILTKKEKKIINEMRADENKNIICFNGWDVKYKYNGLTIPFYQALNFVHTSDLFYKTKTERSGYTTTEYFSLTELGKTISL